MMSAHLRPIYSVTATLVTVRKYRVDQPTEEAHQGTTEGTRLECRRNVRADAGLVGVCDAKVVLEAGAGNGRANKGGVIAEPAVASVSGGHCSKDSRHIQQRAHGNNGRLCVQTPIVDLLRRRPILDSFETTHGRFVDGKAVVELAFIRNALTMMSTGYSRLETSER